MKKNDSKFNYLPPPHLMYKKIMKPPPRDPTHHGLSMGFQTLPKPCHDLPENICFCFGKFSLTKLFNGSLHCISKHYKTHHPSAHLPPHQSSAFQRYQECGGCCHGLWRSNLLYMTNKPPS